MTRNRRDINQDNIIACLKKNRYKYHVTADVKCGFADILARSHSGILVLLEIKHDNLKLTPDEEQFSKKFTGSPVHVVETCEDIVEIMRHYDSQEIIIWRERYQEKEQL